MFIGKMASMFANKHKFIIHQANQPCTPTPIEENEKSIQHEIKLFISANYPKQKFISLVFDTLLKHNLINNDLIFTHFPNIHVADFCSHINNRFDKNSNVRMLNLCKYLQKNNVKFPLVCIRNPLARKFLC